MNKEQRDYIELENAAKEWINKTDDSQFETYELLAMFASGEIEKLFSLPDVIPRYFIDERAGCAAVRDREHPKYDKDYQGLHYDTIDVVEYKHGITEGGKWIVDPKDLEYLNKRCAILNGA